MSSGEIEKVVRYCPECGRKFNAPAQQFESPRICPACKTRVLFLPYQAQPEIPPVPTEPPERPAFSKSLRNAALAIAVGGSAVLLIAMLGAVIAGSFTGFFVFACVLLVAGIVGICVFLESTGKLAATQSALAVREEQIREAAANQTKYLTLYHGLKKNFDSIVNDESERLETEWKRRLDEAAQILKAAESRQSEVDQLAASQRVALTKMAEKMLSEIRKSIKSKLNATNFATSKERFLEAVAFCQKYGYTVPPEMVASFQFDLERDYEQAVRTQLAKEEQARIRELMREEARAEKELAKELARIEAEEQAIRNAIAAALLRNADEHSAEVESLRQRLAEAEARAERTKSMAQLTKAGNVYVISNIGAMGENVFKIGMTRRLEPLDRVKELGDASVPFPFDVHMMIASDNAPALEAALHREFHKRRVNRVNFRKEFFRVSVDEIARVVERECGKVDYVIQPEAIEYRETLTLSEADFEFISSQVNPEKLEED